MQSIRGNNDRIGKDRTLSGAFFDADHFADFGYTDVCIRRSDWERQHHLRFDDAGLVYYFKGKTSQPYQPTKEDFKAVDWELWGTPPPEEKKS